MFSKQKQLELVTYLSQGFTIKEIADKITQETDSTKTYSPRTLEKIVSEMLRTHGCVNATQLVAEFIRKEIIK